MAALVTLTIDGQLTSCEIGRILLDFLQSAGFLVSAACSGHGVCHLCRIQLVCGTASPPTDIEHRALAGAQLAQGLRLACQVRVQAPLTVCLPLVSPLR